MTVMYIIATVVAGFLPRTSAGVTRGGNPLADTIAGLRYIGRETIILLLVVFSICHIISGQPFQQFLPVFTEDILKVSASKLGLMMSVSGIGALIGSLVLASLPNRKRGLMLLLSGVIMGLPIIVFSFSHWWYLSLAVIPFIGLGPTMHSTLTATLVQSYVEPSYRGRMQSFVTMSMGLASLGSFLAGVLAEAIGVQWSIAGMAIFLTITSVMFLTLAPRLRKLE
jgi:predicted MFS family arabinose efflux permease